MGKGLNEAQIFDLWGCTLAYGPTGVPKVPVKIVTNHSSNLPDAALEAYGILRTDQVLIVDGEVHQTRDIRALADIDRWVARAKVHPYIVGTTAAEFVKVLGPLTRTEEEAVVITTSQKVIESYNAAVKALGTLESMRGGAERFGVADSGVTDIGTGLACVYAAALAREGVPLAGVLSALERFRANVRFGFTLRSLDYLVKGGRASAVRAWLARMLKVRPLLAMERGEVQVAGRLPAEGDASVALAEYLTRGIEGQPVWIALLHGNAPELAAGLEQELRRRVDVRFASTRPTTVSTYLHSGPGTVGGVVLPLNALPGRVPVPDAGLFG